MNFESLGASTFLYDYDGMGENKAPARHSYRRPRAFFSLMGRLSLEGGIRISATGDCVRHPSLIILRISLPRYPSRLGCFVLMRSFKCATSLSLLESRAVPAKKKRGLTQLIRRPFRRSQPPRSPRPLRGAKFLCFCPCGFPPAYTRQTPSKVEYGVPRTLQYSTEI